MVHEKVWMPVVEKKNGSYTLILYKDSMSQN